MPVIVATNEAFLCRAEPCIVCTSWRSDGCTKDGVRDKEVSLQCSTCIDWADWLSINVPLVRCLTPDASQCRRIISLLWIFLISFACTQILSSEYPSWNILDTCRCYKIWFDNQIGTLDSKPLQSLVTFT